MRNPERLTKCYEEIKTLHAEKVPDWRIGQLFINFIRWHDFVYRTDTFYIEEDEFIKRFKEFLESSVE